LAEVVHLAGDSAVFPSRWAQVAELALEHETVRVALRADLPLLSTEHIITQLNELRDLIGDGYAGR
jgi:2-phospho-L-lactate guanylyltransferase (CobY/MobA/RfbA family)